MQRTTVFLTDKQIKALKALRENTGLAISEMIRRAIDRYIRRETKR